MLQNKSFLGCIVIGFLLLTAFGLPKNIAKKVTKEIEKVFQIAEVKMTPFSIPEALNNELPQKLNATNFYRLTAADEFLGYAFVDKASSKTAQFDYLVIFDSDLKIMHSKVLIYREEYGGEIGSKRWLKQFLGKTGGDRVSHERNIDGIAGATISVRSMTNAVDHLLQSVAVLQSNGVL